MLHTKFRIFDWYKYSLDSFEIWIFWFPLWLQWLSFLALFRSNEICGDANGCGNNRQKMDEPTDLIDAIERIHNNLVTPLHICAVLIMGSQNKQNTSTNIHKFFINVLNFDILWVSISSLEKMKDHDWMIATANRLSILFIPVSIFNFFMEQNAFRVAFQCTFMLLARTGTKPSLFHVACLNRYETILAIFGCHGQGLDLEHLTTKTN